MADNVTLNAGTGGATLRTLADSGGTEWPVGVAAYATTISPDANVLQVVTPGYPLPVAATIVGTLVVDAVVASVDVVQPDPASLQCTATLAPNQKLDEVTTVGSIANPVAATQSGSWTATVSQSTASNLQTTANQGGSWTVTANQGGTWNVGTVSTVTAVTGITNPVTVAQSNAANLLATVSLAANQTLATVTNVTTVGTITNPVTVAQATAANLKCTASIAAGQTLDAVTNVGAVGTITNAVTVAQPTAANLNATATLAAGSNLVGKVSNGCDTSTLYNGTTALTPLFARFAANTSGKTTIVSAAGAGKKIRVLRWSASAFGDVNAALWSGSTSAISGLKYLTKYASAGGAYCPVGVCETAANEALTLDLSASVSTSGEVTYVVV
jgi:hypothetical protein